MYAVVEVVASMKIIKELISQIHDEVKDANKYIECALKYRDEDRGLADMYNNLSLEEVKEIKILQSMYKS